MREPGEDDEDRDEPDAPRDGRQLLGWSRKQQPDALGELMSFGRRNGFASKIVNWTPDQAMAAWAHVRASRARAQTTRRRSPGATAPAGSTATTRTPSDLRPPRGRRPSPDRPGPGVASGT